MHAPTDNLAGSPENAEGRITPQQWPWALSAAPIVSSEATAWDGALLRRWSGTSSVMVQPALDQHYIVMHLGGPKHVTRRRDAAPVSTVAESGSLTLVPAGTAFTWRTTGPIAFAHLYVRPRQLENAITREFELEGRGASLIERVGCRDPLLESLFAKMIDEIQTAAGASALLLDSLFESFLLRLARGHSTRPTAERLRAVSLAPHRLQRVLEFIEANLDRNVALADLVGAAGSSQYHFSRAFHEATGHSPYRYLIQRRIEYAKVLLMTSGDALEAVSSKCGFRSRHQFAVMFKRLVGVGPKRFRMTHRSPAA